MTIYSLDVLFSQFGNSPLFHVQFKLLLLDPHTCFSGGRWGGLVFHLFKNFPVCCDHTVIGFSIISGAVIDVFFFFSEMPCFLYDAMNVGNFISGYSVFSKPSLYIWKFLVQVLLKPRLKDFEHGEWVLYLSMSNQQTSSNCRTIKNKTELSLLLEFH